MLTLGFRKEQRTETSMSVMSRCRRHRKNVDVDKRNQVNRKWKSKKSEGLSQQKVKSGYGRNLRLKPKREKLKKGVDSFDDYD